MVATRSKALSVADVGLLASAVAATRAREVMVASDGGAPVLSMWVKTRRTAAAGLRKDERSACVFSLSSVKPVY